MSTAGGMGKRRRPSLLGISRRVVQLGVIVLILAIPALARYNNYLAAYELDRKIEKWVGTVQGVTLASIDTVIRTLPGAEIERAGRMQRKRDVARSYAQSMQGGVWSAQLGPVSLTDPLAAAESVAASRKLPWVLAAGLAIPLLATLLLGRIFCSWICPVGFLLELSDKLRGVLRFLEIKPRNLRFSFGMKYSLLAVGLLLTALSATPVLAYVYPPAVFNRELHDLVFAMFDRAENGKPGLWLGGLSWMAMLLAAIALFEVLLSRRWWCRYVCPGGALYALLGWSRPLRVKLKREACTDCAACTAACPMGLNPMKGQMGIECDNCGVCITACGDDALDYGFAMPTSPETQPLPQSQGTRA